MFSACCRQRESAPPACVLITGAAGGIGACLAREFVAAGAANVVLVDIDAAALARVKASLSLPAAPRVCVHALVCDVAAAADVASLFTRVILLTGCAPDVIISNAGVVNGADIDALPAASLERCFRVNTFAAFHLVREALPHMKAARRGSVVLVSSVMGLIGGARLTDYCASKWALLGMLESLRLELQRDGLGGQIGCIAVLPYVTSTGLFRGIFEDPRAANPLRAWLFPPLSPASVAAETLRAVRRGGDAVVTLPAVLYWAAIFSKLLPLSLSDAIAGYFGGWHGMSSFIGHSSAATAGIEAASTAAAATTAPQQRRSQRAEDEQAPPRRRRRRRSAH